MIEREILSSLQFECFEVLVTYKWFWVSQGREVLVKGTIADDSSSAHFRIRHW